MENKPFVNQVYNSTHKLWGQYFYGKEKIIWNYHEVGGPTGIFVGNIEIEEGKNTFTGSTEDNLGRAYITGKIIKEEAILMFDKKYIRNINNGVVIKYHFSAEHFNSELNLVDCLCTLWAGNWEMTEVIDSKTYKRSGYTHCFFIKDNDTW